MKRFYKQSSAVAAEVGFQITLDGRPVLTPGRTVICVPSMVLAEAIALEWAGQGAEIDPESMPLTRIAATALDRAGPQRAAVCQAIIAYAPTDLLCYRAQSPVELVARQAAAWQPILDWAASQFDAPMMVTGGIVPVTQSPSSLDALAKAVHALDNFQLAALSTATAASGSLIIGLALAHGHLTSAQAFAASQVDETFQAEQWGLDEQAEQTRQGHAADLNAVGQFFAMLAA